MLQQTLQVRIVRVVTRGIKEHLARVAVTITAGLALTAQFMQRAWIFGMALQGKALIE